MKRFLLSVLFMAATAATFAQGQLKLPALSTNAKISQDFSLSNIDISYGRPSMRGRRIFGEVVPYGHVWRTGANAPTKIKTGEDLEIGGQKVKAGEYVLYTIPGKDKWEIVLNTGVVPLGPDGYPRENDVARFTVPSSSIEGNCQTFTILITDITYTTCKIEMVWERTKIAIPIVARNADKVDVNIDNAINHPTPLPYFQAANYYYETTQNTELAKTYIDKATEGNPKNFAAWLLKARIERRLGNKEAAIAAARKSMETAKGTTFEPEYIRNSQQIIDDISHSKHNHQDTE